MASHAGSIKGIVVTGNENISADAILNEIPFKIGSEYDNDTADSILKRLHETMYFDDIIVDINNDVVNITVVENPMINKIAYEGMKHSIKDLLRDVIKLKPRQILFKPAIQETQQIILEMYRHQGYLSARVAPKIIRLPNNRVNVVFEVYEGSSTYVKKVAFIGNKMASSKELRDMLSIKEKRIYHLAFIGGTKDKVYDSEKFVEDQQMLVRYYLSQGYADFEIVSATAELSPDKKDFFITYYLKEGDVYKFGDISVDSKIEKLKNDVLAAGIMAKKDQVFNGEMVEFCADLLKGLARSCGYNFAVVEPVFTKNEKTKTVDVKFIVKDGPKIYVEKINIKGNRNTRDRVIRRDIRFNEGDAFDQKQLKPAESRIKESGFFKTVRIDATNGSVPNSAIITVDVAEEHTGSVSARLGYSTFDHAVLEFGISDPNHRGKGQQLDFSVSYAKKSFEGVISLVEPYFLERRLMGGVELSHTRSKHMKGTIHSDTGISPSLGYKFSRHVTQHWSYKLHRDSTTSVLTEKEQSAAELSKSASNDFKTWLESKEGKEHSAFIDSHYSNGVRWGSAVTHTLSFDNRNRGFLPSRGYHLYWGTTVSGLGGSIKYIKNTWGGSWHHKVYKDVAVSMRGAFSCITTLGENKLHRMDALYVGGESLRGFERLGVSPVRGPCNARRLQAIDRFIDKSGSLSYLSDSQKTFITDNKESIRKYFTGELNGVEKFNKENLTAITSAAIREKQSDVLQFVQLQSVESKKLGGTRSCSGSLEFSCPMSEQAGIYGTVFADCGAAWRSDKIDGTDITSVKNDEFSLRCTVGACIAWNSPFGVISIGYARPLVKKSGDVECRVLLGYGMNFK
ncbi:MAG: outer membrane protein assembly factor BamA [Holosporales bacterium]|nr:outer membrane protein assembly factor BamA [Holosporales bacterium]